MTLYEIDQAIADIMENAVDEETGEIDESIYEALDNLQMERDRKIENIGLAYKSWSAFADDIKAEKQALEKRQKQAEKRVESLKRYMQYALNGEKFKTPKVAVSYRKTQSVQINALELIPEEFLRFKDPEADKAKIKEAITKHGEIVPGAEVVESVSMSIK